MKKFILTSAIALVLTISSQVNSSACSDFEESDYQTALSLRNAKKLSEARPLFASVAVSESPLAIKALHNLGSIASKQGKHAEAYEWFKKSMQKSETLNREPLTPTINNIKTLETNYGSTGELERKQKHDSAPVPKGKDIADISAGMYEYEGHEYKSSNTYGLIAWMQGKTPSGNLLHEKTAETNLILLGKFDFIYSPILRLNEFPYLSPEKGMVRFSYYFNPMTMARPCDIKGYIFHLDRPLQPWDELTEALPDSEQKQSIEKYLEYFLIPEFPLLTKEEADYMKAQDENCAYLSSFANQQQNSLEIDQRDQDLIKILRRLQGSFGNPVEALEFYQSILEKPETSPYNFGQSVEMMLIILKESYSEKYVVSLINTYLKSPKTNTATKISSLYKISGFKDIDPTLKFRLLMETIDLLEETPSSYRNLTLYKSALHGVGLMLERGFDGQNPNRAEAFKHYKKAAELGDIFCANNAGVLLKDGFEGQSPNPAEALRYFKFGAELGDSKSAYNAALLLYDGFDTQKPNLSGALKYSKIAADLGHVVAAHNAGFMLKNGFEGQEPNLPEAVKYFKIAANHGDISCAFDLGNILLNGFNGYPPNFAEALIYFKIGANLGDADSAFNVGLMLENGFEGQPINLAEALTYFQKSADLGNDQANVAVVRLQQKMNLS